MEREGGRKRRRGRPRGGDVVKGHKKEREGRKRWTGHRREDEGGEGVGVSWVVCPWTKFGPILIRYLVTFHQTDIKRTSGPHCGTVGSFPALQ